MIHFDKTNIEVTSNHTVTLSCDTWVVFEHDDSEAVAFGTPEYWDEAVQTVFGSGYTVWEIFEKALPRSACNRITDHKKVWGLLGLPEGKFAARVDCEEKSVYLGASYGLKTLKDSKAYSYFLLSNADEASAARVWDDFCGEYAARQCNDFIGSALAVAAKERDFIALYYSYTDKAALTIVCTAPERIAGELRSIPVPDGIVPHYRCFWR